MSQEWWTDGFDFRMSLFFLRNESLILDELFSKEEAITSSFKIPPVLLITTVNKENTSYLLEVAHIPEMLVYLSYRDVIVLVQNY